MRDLTLDQRQALSGPGTYSWVYVSLELDEKLYMTNGKEREIDGNEYKKGLMGSVEHSHEQAVITIANPDGKYTMGAINGDFYRKEVVISVAPGDNTGFKQLLEPGYVEFDYYEQPSGNVLPIIDFSGHIAYIEDVSDYITVVAERSVARRFPRGRIVAPFANYVAQEGAVINFGSKVIRIESRLKRGKIS